MTGPFRFIRHPIYAVVLVLVWSSMLVNASLSNVVISLLMTIVTGIRIATEEEFLRARYPSYAEYARKTRRIIPFIF